MRRARAGFSLIEVMVVVAIIGILAGLSVAAYSQVGSASAPRNAINDLTANLLRARSTATANQTDVWVVFYPQYSKATPAVTGGPGAYFLYEDKAGTFGRTTSGSAGEVHYLAAGSGTTFNPVTGALYGSASAEGRLVEAIYLDDYPGDNVFLALPSGGVTMAAAQAPFAAMGALGSACTFCTGVPRGAVVFAADGSARFVDATGGADASRSRAVTLRSANGNRVYVVAVAGPTGFVGTYDLR